MPEPLKLQDIKQRMASYGLRPHKQFGQNFLADFNMLHAIVADAQVDAGDCVPGISTHGERCIATDETAELVDTPSARKHGTERMNVVTTEAFACACLVPTKIRFWATAKIRLAVVRPRRYDFRR